MKKNIFLFASLALLSIGAKAQTSSRITINIPEKDISLKADKFSLTNDGCMLEGNVTQEPIDEKFPIIDEHHVPGILTNMNQIGGTWVLQCTAGPGYCFTWYSK